MSVTAGPAKKLLSIFRPRRSVFVIMGLFVLLVIQYFARLVLGIGDGLIGTVLDLALDSFIGSLMWVLSPVPQSLLYETAFAIPAVLVYSYLLAAAFASAGEAIAPDF